MRKADFTQDFLMGLFKVEEILVVENCPLCSHSLQFLLFDRQNNHHSFFFSPSVRFLAFDCPLFILSLVAAAFVSKKTHICKEESRVVELSKMLRPAKGTFTGLQVS